MHRCGPRSGTPRVPRARSAARPRWRGRVAAASSCGSGDGPWPPSSSRRATAPDTRRGRMCISATCGAGPPSPVAAVLERCRAWSDKGPPAFLGVVASLLGEPSKPTVRGDPDCPGALAQHRPGGAGIQPDHRPQQHRLGLLLRKGSDQPECQVGRQRVECAGSGVAGARGLVAFAVRGGRDGRATGVDPARSIARWCTIVAAQPRNRSTSPLNRCRSRLICNHASAVTSSALSRPTRTVA